MSPILDVQRRYRELGRLRLGYKATKGGKVVPQRLATWRLTSPSDVLLRAAAELWGGEVQPWEDAPTEGEQWELVTETDELNVYVPPQDVTSSQWFELWSRGGVQRRCDGETEAITGRACLCDPDDRECSVTTHLLVLLPQIPDVGVWRVRTTSWNAAAELPSTVELLGRIHEAGALPIAVLGIEARTKVAEGKTRHYSLPVLRFPSSIAEAEAAGIPVLSRAKDRPALPSVKPELPTDARFAHDRASWGDPPDLPSDVPPPPSQEATTTGEQATGAGESSDDPMGKGGDEDPPPAAIKRYVDAVERVGGPQTARTVVLPLAKAERWGWPPREDWPVDRFDRMSELLEGAGMGGDSGR